MVLVVCNEPALARALERAMPFPLSGLCPSERDSVSDILAVLRDKSQDADVLYLDAQLVFGECPDPSYYGGIELCKHIRLTPSLEPLSLLPIVIGTVDAPEYCIRQSADNVILFSPGCEAIKLPGSLANLREALRRRRAFADYEQMGHAIKPYVWFTDDDEKSCEHAYRNRAGVGKFLKEFAGLSETDPDYLKYEGVWQSKVWFKKMRFLQPQAQSVPAFNRSAEELKKLGSHRYIYIDDEHQLGWSFGLHTGLFGRSAEPAVFDDGVPRVETSDGRFMCIAKPDEAERFFRTEANKLEKALSEWVEKEQQLETVQNHREALKGVRSIAKKQIGEVLPYHLAFLDLRLEPEDERRPPSEFSGMRLLQKIKNEFPELPVIVISASKQALSAEEARKWGADGYWIKDMSSGEELKNAILKCLIKAELREIWRAIRMVEAQAKILCQEWDLNTVGFKPRVLPEKKPAFGQRAMKLDRAQEAFEPWLDRGLIVQWLRESFQLLWDVDEIRKPAFHDDDYPYDRVILNMGLIQELRFKRLDDWTETSLKGVQYKQGELKLRRRRNDMAHTNPSALAERAETISFFKFTLNRLLGWEFFSELLARESK